MDPAVVQRLVRKPYASSLGAIGGRRAADAGIGSAFGRIFL
jgi:hypothetical protein